MELSKIFASALAKHKPKVIQEKDIHEFLLNLNESLKKKGLDAVAILGGSVAKGTHLSLYDCDIFVIFDVKYKDQDLSKLLSSAVDKKIVVHGSRDYFQKKHKGIIFEIIPVLKMENSADVVNVTDISPLHVKWINDNIGKLRDDVRLAKIFCKAQGFYGAESHICGFSGYMLELLVINYGGFVNLLKAAANFKPKQIIDLMNYYKNREELFSKMNSAKLQSPIIVIDPVQPDRNAAASITEESFAKFILLAKLFLEKPSIDFFIKKPFSLQKIKAQSKSGINLLLFKIKPEEGKEDIVGSKLIKVFDHIARHLELAEFKILDKGKHWEKTQEGKKATKAYLWYYVYPNKLPALERHLGPVIYSSPQHIKAFTQKHKSFIVEDNRLVALRSRKFRDLSAFAKSMLKDPFIKERVKKIRC